MTNEERLIELLTHKDEIIHYNSYEYYNGRLCELLNRVAPDYMRVVHHRLMQIYESTKLELEIEQDPENQPEFKNVMNWLLMIISKFNPDNG